MRGLVIGTAAGILLAGAASAQAPVLGAYLGPERWPDAAQILPPPPSIGTPRQAQDLAVYRATRNLQGDPRWSLAEADVPTLPPAMLKTFACALGVDLTPETAPQLTTLLSRVGLDVGRQTASVKDVFQRPRPYLLEEGPICVAKSEELAASPDYPSGHAAWGWAVGLILAELAPDRATAILTRARAYGESRVVCGVHTPSAVEAGRTNGAALVAALHGQTQFRQDLEGARAELARARSPATPASGACAAEEKIVSQPAW